MPILNFTSEGLSRMRVRSGGPGWKVSTYIIHLKVCLHQMIHLKINYITNKEMSKKGNFFLMHSFWRSEFVIIQHINNQPLSTWHDSIVETILFYKIPWKDAGPVWSKVRERTLLCSAWEGLAWRNYHIMMKFIIKIMIFWFLVGGREGCIDL